MFGIAQIRIICVLEIGKERKCVREAERERERERNRKEQSRADAQLNKYRGEFCAKIGIQLKLVQIFHLYNFRCESEFAELELCAKKGREKEKERQRRILGGDFST